ncbi:MAG: hypothetical protein O7J95_20445 [Planctomycetota bacterium]|nr:hypothetical protein [Planctomycetota bacterium]
MADAGGDRNPTAPGHGRVRRTLTGATAAVVLSLAVPAMLRDVLASDVPTQGPGDGGVGSPLEGGLGAPPAAPAERQKTSATGARQKDRKDGTKPASPGPGEKKPPGAGASGTSRPASVKLPRMGIYRAPRILRLAGELTGQPVVVARKELNDRAVAIPRRLSERRATLEELKRVLELSGFYLFEWVHPRKGPILVASEQRNWQPPASRRKRRTLDVAPRIFAPAESAVREEVAQLNRKTGAGTKSRYQAFAVARLGKIYLWGPSEKGLDRIAERVEELRPADEGRPKLYSYEVRHRRAELLAESLLDELTDSEQRRTRVSVGDWRNVILYRTSRKVAVTIDRLLRELDVPTKRHQGTTMSSASTSWPERSR